MTKELIHEEILQGKKFPYFPLPNDADQSVDQHFFVNRKVDRFTLSGRYFARGTNSLGKKWSKWRTSFTLSFTLKQPKESKETRLNIFITGKGFGRFSSKVLGVRNITRQPEVYLAYLPDDFKVFAIEELEDLYKRMGLDYTNPVTLNRFAENLRNLAYPSNNLVTDNSVPLFAGELLRAQNRQDVSKFLFSKDKNIRKQFAESNFTLSVEKLGYALLTKNIIPDSERYEFITGEENGIKQGTFTEKTLFEPGLSYDSLITLTRFLKRLPLENRRLIITSEIPYSIVETINKWNAIKDIAQTLAYDQIKSWEEARIAIERLDISFTKENNSDSETEEFLSLVNSIFEDIDFVKIESSSYQEDIKFVIGKGSPGYFYFSHHMFWSVRSKKFYTGINWLAIKNDSLIHSIIQNDPYTPYRKQNTKSKALDSQSVQLSAKAGYYLLSYLKEKAEENLSKYHVEINKENIAKYILLEFLLNSEYKLRNIGNKVPTAFYKLLKMEIDMENILFFLQRKVPISTASSLSAMPKNWIIKALNLPEGDFADF